MLDKASVDTSTRPGGEYRVYRASFIVLHLCMAVLVLLVGPRGGGHLVTPLVGVEIHLSSFVLACAFVILPLIKGKVEDTHAILVNAALEAMAFVALQSALGMTALRRYLHPRPVLLWSVVGVGLSCLVIWYNLFAAEHVVAGQMRSQLRRTLDHVGLLVCEEPIDATTVERLAIRAAEFNQLPEGLDPAQPELKALIGALTAAVTPVVQRDRNPGDPKSPSLPKRCESAASDLHTQCEGPSRAALLSLLCARLWLRASQQGANESMVAKAEEVLSSGASQAGWIESDPVVQRGLGSDRVRIAYSNYLGVCEKFKAEALSLRIATEPNQRVARNRAISAAWLHYQDSGREAARFGHSRALARSNNNLTDLRLFLASLVLSKAIDPKIEQGLDEVVLAELQDLQQPNRVREMLEERIESQRQGYAESPVPAILVTLAQAHCLLGMALAVDPGEEAAASVWHLDAAVTILDVVADALDESLILLEPKRFLLQPLLESSERTRGRFEAVQARVRSRL